MENVSWVALAITAGLLLCFSGIAGCSDTPAPAAEVTTAPVQLSAQYAAGDIVKNPQSSSEAGFLIISYDPATDMYERAYIYPNSDGSWGYRLDTSSEKVSRSVVEQVYTAKSGTISVSSVPVGAPVVTTATVTTTRTTPVAGTTTATTTTSSNPAPRVKGITPDKGKAGTTITISDLEGQYFLAGANVTLEKHRQTSMKATNLVITSIKITGKLAIPSDAENGYWDVVVTNPDGKSDKYENAFLVQEGVAGSTTTGTTTTTVAANSPTITDIDPEFIPAAQYTEIRIYGTNFRPGLTTKLTKEYKADIPQYTSCQIDSSTQIRCFFNVPAGSQGNWNLVIRNTDGTTITKDNVFTVNS